MASSGSQGRGPTNSGSKAFDFASDDILCSYEDYGNQDGNNGTHSDPSVAANSAMEFHKSRMARSSVFPGSTYSPPEESSFHQDVISSVENTMKKYTDNLMRFLEGISSRLSQLELYCYNLDKSIGEMRADLVRDHGDSGSKLKNLEKHIEEVHRSVQILRDKQELADTQKELAKLQLAQKESSSTGNNTPKASQTAMEAKTSDNSSDGHDDKLALALPHQVAPQPSLPARPVEHQQQQPLPPPQSSMPPQSMPQGYYLPPQQMTNMPPPQPPQTQYQIQDHSRMPPQPSQPQVNQTPQVQSLPPYQQQWAPQQQPPPPAQPPQQPLMPPQIRPSSQSQLVYSSYVPTQANQNPSPEIVPPPNSMPMQVSYVGSSQPGSDAIPPYGYGATAGRPIQPQHNIKIGYGPGPQSGEGYGPSGPRPALPPGNAYMMFDGEGGRSHFQQSPYPPNTMTIPSQNPQRMPNANIQSMRGHPYSELIEKLVNMGYRGDHVVGIIQRLEESGQPIDFNSVLDRLNGHSSGGGSQRGWSG